MSVPSSSSPPSSSSSSSSSSSEPSPNTTPSPSDPYPDHTVERTGLIYPLCAAVLCERWAASTLISTGATMLCERYGFSRPDSLRMWGLLSAVCYVGAVPGGYLLDRTCSPSRGLSGSLLLLVLGYVVLSMPFRAAVLVGFALLALGQSLYKPSTQRVLSSLFPSTNSRLGLRSHSRRSSPESEWHYPRQRKGIGKAVMQRRKTAVPHHTQRWHPGVCSRSLQCSFPCSFWR